MPVSFPALKPISASLEPANFPVKSFRSINGKATTRLYGSRGSDHPLNLEFLVLGENSALILAAWYSARGKYDSLTLPNEVFAALTAAKRATIPTYLRWKFLSAPQVSFGGAPGWSKVSVQLNGEVS